MSGRPRRAAACFTGEGSMPRPRPLGRSGWVTHMTTVWPLAAAANTSRLGTASSAVPKKMMRMDAAAAPPGDSIDEEPPLQMIELVLQHNGQQSVSVNRHGPAPQILSPKADAGGAPNPLPHVGQ